jgi:DNA (cytosine-5)-methyltransferase 1
LKLRAIDLFGGAGGLTAGLRAAGFEVLGAVDSLPLAIAAYRANHPGVRVWQKDIRRLDPEAVRRELGLKRGDLDLLAGCPPCQGFSSIRTMRKSTAVEDPRNTLVAQFARWAEALRPRALMMENVPGLAEDIRLSRAIGRLERAGYSIVSNVLDAADYGVPQRRRRLVMLGILDGEVFQAAPAARRFTVREAISHLPHPHRSDDALHSHGEQRNDRIRRRIASIPPEGSLTQLGPAEQLACHRRSSGFYDVYGRMRWDQPAPTITGGCINPSKGRFLHPQQNRAITLREAALLQSFPADYLFPLDRGKYHAATLIGNALPPLFAQHQAQALASAL